MLYSFCVRFTISSSVRQAATLPNIKTIYRDIVSGVVVVFCNFGPVNCCCLLHALAPYPALSWPSTLSCLLLFTSSSSSSLLLLFPVVFIARCCESFPNTLNLVHTGYKQKLHINFNKNRNYRLSTLFHSCAVCRLPLDVCHLHCVSHEIRQNANSQLFGY